MTSFIMFIIINILSYFRYELLGIRPNYAPHNFGFNIVFLIPIILLSGIVSLCTFLCTIYYWKSLSSLFVKILILGLTSFVIISILIAF